MKIPFVSSIGFDASHKKEMNKSSCSDLDLTRVAFPISSHKCNYLYYLHKNKLNEKLDKKQNESKNNDIKIVNEDEKMENIAYNNIKDNDDIFELYKNLHEKKMEEIRLMQEKMLEEMNNNMLNIKRKRTNKLVSDKPNYDKIMKKIRIMILNSIIIFINKMIKIIYNNNIMKVF